ATVSSIEGMVNRSRYICSLWSSHPGSISHPKYHANTPLDELKEA
ncbi:MAG: hypothetical protein ACI9HK_004122, partial [Pirellulaceae bacterium]